MRAMRLKKRNWIVIEAEGTPVARVAARALGHRLTAVWTETVGSVGDRHAAERVHRLRVATRRALAAFEAFDDVVPPRQLAWFRKRLRTLRRSAGDARDLDVLTARLAKSGEQSIEGRPRVSLTGSADTVSSAAAKARGRLVTMLAKQRDRSRQPIREAYERLLEEDWSHRVDMLLGDLDPDPAESGRAVASSMTFGRYARRRFRPLMARFFIKADQRLRTAAELHDLRIAGKRFRYALEIFAGVFPPGVREECEQALERLQETLGKFTDHAAAADRFRRWARDESMAADRATLVVLRREEAARADSARKVFAAWWNADRRRELRRTFERSLTRKPA